jgi:hypothetical protein
MEISRYAKLYSIIIVTALILHVFNTLQINEEIKYFHLAVVLALGVYIVLLKKKKDRVFRYSKIFIIGALLSFVTSPADNLMATISLCVVVLSSIGMKDIDGMFTVRCANIGIPIALLGLLFYYFQDIPFRYTGFYTDPNYLCTTLILFLFLILFEFISTKRIIIKVLLTIEIVIVFFLISTTLSRSGVFCTIVLLGLSQWAFFKKKKMLTLLVTLFSAFLIVQWQPEFINNAVEGFTIRQELSKDDDINSAGRLRIDLSTSGVEYVISHPQYLIQGIGVEGTNHRDSFLGMKKPLGNVRDHNTFTSIFTEHGIVGVVCFSMILYSLFIYLKRIPKSTEKRIMIAAIISILFLSLSIYQLYFFPFWFFVYILFGLSNSTRNKFKL